MNPYQKLLNRKRTWTPVQTTAGKLVEGAEETIYRALAIRHMELPVGDFIHDALKNSTNFATRPKTPKGQGETTSVYDSIVFDRGSFAAITIRSRII